MGRTDRTHQRGDRANTRGVGVNVIHTEKTYSGSSASCIWAAAAAATAVGSTWGLCGTLRLLNDWLVGFVLAVHVLGEVESVFKADLVAKTFLLSPFPDLLHTSAALDDVLLGTRDVAAIDGNVDSLIARLDGGPIGDGIVSRYRNFWVGSVVGVFKVANGSPCVVS